MHAFIKMEKLFISKPAAKLQLKNVGLYFPGSLPFTSLLFELFTGGSAVPK